MVFGESRKVQVGARRVCVRGNENKNKHNGLPLTIGRAAVACGAGLRPATTYWPCCCCRAVLAVGCRGVGGGLFVGDGNGAEKANF